jgi:hypothetical protein
LELAPTGRPINNLRIDSLKALRAEMMAVTSEKKKAPADASQTSFESAVAIPLARLLTRKNRACWQ